MEKTIRIGNKDFKMSSSAYTQFKYKNDTGRSLMADLSATQDKYKDLLEGKIDLDQLDELIELILKIAFIMTNENDKSQAPTYEDFLKQIDNYFIEMDWLNEVVELATSPFHRGIQIN